MRINWYLQINQPNIAHLDPYYRNLANYIFGDEFKTYDSGNLTGNPPGNSFENKMYSPTAMQACKCVASPSLSLETSMLQSVAESEPVPEPNQFKMKCDNSTPTKFNA